MKSFFEELFEYNHHCNLKLAEAFLEHPWQTSLKSRELFSHLLNAHQIWNSRIIPGREPFAVWEVHVPETYGEILRKNQEDALYILGHFDLNQAIGYSNTKGQQFSNTVRDILFHIVNHSTYHRGQIALEFRQGELDPLVTDYIFYKR